MSYPESGITFCIKDWAACAPGLTCQQDWQESSAGKKAPSVDQSFDVKQVPPMLRRRLGTLGKAVAYTLCQIAWDAHIPSVFCSRHGAIQQTYKLLSDLADVKPLSPAHFSLSVHNAIAGMLSIARKDVSSITALSAGTDGLWQMLLEAYGQLEQPGVEEVLCVIYDEPLPELYTRYVNDTPFTHALSFVLSKQKDKGQAVTLKSVDLHHASSARDKDTPPALQFIRFLSTDTLNQIVSTGHSNQWMLSKTE